MLRKLFLILTSILIITVLLVPKESDYFQRLENDYGKIHYSVSLNKEMLKEVGEYEYRNQLIYSKFEYSFGSISVSYYGFLNIILFQKSKNRVPKSPNITV